MFVTSFSIQLSLSQCLLDSVTISYLSHVVTKLPVSLSSPDADADEAADPRWSESDSESLENSGSGMLNRAMRRSSSSYINLVGNNYVKSCDHLRPLQTYSVTETVVTVTLVTVIPHLQ